MERITIPLSQMATARNTSSKMVQAGDAVAVAAPSSVSTVSLLEIVQLNDWQKAIKYDDSQFKESEFAVAEFASLQRYNLILIQNQLANIKA